MRNDFPSKDVILLKCKEYVRSELVSHIDTIGEFLGVANAIRGKIVLLKPNLISSRAPFVACTHAEFVAAAASWFIEQGAKVRLGDSPAFGSVEAVCERQGITLALKGMGVEIVKFSTPVVKKLECGTAVAISKEALECDLLVGLPKLKAHNQMLVTMAVKNLFGTIVGARKAMLHMTKGSTHDTFARVVLGLQPLFPRQVHLIDGIEVMSGSGPMDGIGIKLDLIGGAISPVALDTALMQVLGLDLWRSPLWRVAVAAGVVGSDPETLRYPFFRPEDFSPKDFVTPSGLNPIRFNPLRFLKGMVKRVIVKGRGTVVSR